MTHTTTLKIKIIPKAKKNEIVGTRGEFLVIKIKAVPEKGKANKELVRYLSAILNIPAADISFVRGRAASHKIIALPHASDRVLRRLAQRKT